MGNQFILGPNRTCHTRMEWQDNVSWMVRKKLGVWNKGIAGYGPSGKFKDLTSYKSNKKCLIDFVKTQTGEYIPGIMGLWYSPISGTGDRIRSRVRIQQCVREIPSNEIHSGVANDFSGCFCCSDWKKNHSVASPCKTLCHQTCNTTAET